MMSPLHLMVILGLAGLTPVAGQLPNENAVAPPEPSPSSTPSPEEASETAALQQRTTELTKALDDQPRSIRLHSQRGDAHLFLGEFKQAVADFEKMIEIDPAEDAPHWRLGIAYYFAGQYENSSAQFLKYQTHQSGDRENGIWKLLADARHQGLEKARAGMIEFTRFDREPFPDLYEMFAGKMSGDEVLAALEKKGLAKEGAPQFFAHYYVGVNEALLGRRDAALALLDKAIANPWGRTAEGGPAYMWRCARLHRAEVAAGGDIAKETAGVAASAVGLAAAYPGDVGISAHPDVLFADAFETGELGAGWDEVRNDDSRVLGFTDPADPLLGRRALWVEARLGQNTGGGLTRWFEPVDPVHIRFYVKFDEHCDYVHHFVTLRANRSLEGSDRWSGFGGAGLKPAGDERFSTALEPWGDWGRIAPPGTWNFYSYWHEMKASPDGKFWGNSFRSQAASPIPRGRWICAEFMLKHNTPGQDDGEQAFWIDGVQQGRWKGISWRKTAGLMANAVTLESYVTDRWTKQPVNTVWFDNVVVAKSLIGPTGR
ncbi:MAG: tetratricopeptide repeat protein [Verrucomicrobiales bacterium]